MVGSETIESPRQNTQQIPVYYKEKSINYNDLQPNNNYYTIKEMKRESTQPVSYTNDSLEDIPNSEYNNHN